MMPLGDQSRQFTISLGLSWLFAVALPLTLSTLTGHSLQGLPLLGVVVWIVLLRVARSVSPAGRADAFMRQGRYAEALALAEHALTISGPKAWVGRRRLVWLNRRTSALLALGRLDGALASALEAIECSADPETLGNCAMALLYLNRTDEAERAARLALSLTRERSVAGNAALATVMLSKGMPAEAEAIARAGLADARALSPLVRPEHYAACLCALGRAERLQGRKEASQRVLDDMRKVSGRGPLPRAMAMCEDADGPCDTPEQSARALTLLESALSLAPSYVCWFILQRATLAGVRQQERFAPLAAHAKDTFVRLSEAAPTRDLVALTLDTAERDASPRPAQQSSREALLMQIFTLSGTFVLLIWWTWRFFLVTP